MVDEIVKSLEIVMPDPISLPRTRYGGIQNILNLLDSGFRRNDGIERF